MTTPHPPAVHGSYHAHQPGTHEVNAVTETWGPLVRQPQPAARLARILHNSATDLWDVCTLTDPAQMWEEARAIASRILASCPTE
jgi:hypothetical protein